MELEYQQFAKDIGLPVNLNVSVAVYCSWYIVNQLQLEQPANRQYLFILIVILYDFIICTHRIVCIAYIALLAQLCIGPKRAINK